MALRRRSGAGSREMKEACDRQGACLGLARFCELSWIEMGSSPEPELYPVRSAPAAQLSLEPRASTSACQRISILTYRVAAPSAANVCTLLNPP